MLSGCATELAPGAAGPPAPTGGGTGSTGTGSASTAPSDAATDEPSDAPPAREGRTAASERIRFIPTRVELPGRARADVEPAATVDGELTIPANVAHVGWWDGSAWVNDAFGNTVIAGHVDSKEGFGFFARLLLLKKGEKVTLSAGSHHLTYQITSVRAVERAALATDSTAFDQTGDHRLVLITCTGGYNRSKGGYDHNLVVTARPVGAVH